MGRKILLSQEKWTRVIMMERILLKILDFLQNQTKVTSVNNNIINAHSMIHSGFKINNNYLYYNNFSSSKLFMVRCKGIHTAKNVIFLLLSNLIINRLKIPYRHQQVILGSHSFFVLSCSWNSASLLLCRMFMLIWGRRCLMNSIAWFGSN